MERGLCEEGFDRERMVHAEPGFWKREASGQSRWTGLEKSGIDGSWPVKNALQVNRAVRGGNNLGRPTTFPCHMFHQAKKRGRFAGLLFSPPP